jgi:hypothetical protein
MSAGRARGWLQTAAVWAAFPSTCLAVFLILNAFLEARSKKSVSTAPPMFPVLVITPGSGAEPHYATVVYQKNLRAFLETHREYSYLVPEGEEGKLQDQLEALEMLTQEAAASMDPLASPRRAGFAVRRLTNGRQFLRVEGAWTDRASNTGWYEAEEREFFPKYHRSYAGAGPQVEAGLLATMLTGAAWLVGFSWRIWWR